MALQLKALKGKVAAFLHDVCEDFVIDPNELFD